MSDIAIRVEGLSKRYRIGQHERYKALRDVITDAVASPFRRLRLTGDGRRKTEAPSSVPHRPSPVPSPPSPVSTPPSSVPGPPSDNYIWALKDVSFEVKQGEVVGIIGRNGAGKSTLLKILSRITQPTEGRAVVSGRVGSLLEVGTGFHPELTGRENLYLNGAILGMKKAEIDRKFDEIVAFAEVEKFIDTPVKHYSSGMYVRLAFAVAAHLEPEILLVDEVLAVGDVAFQKKCLGKMGNAAHDGRSVLFVSHNLAAVKALCRFGLLLDQGLIVCWGPATTVIDRYLQPVIPEVCSGKLLSHMHTVSTGELWIDHVSLTNGTGKPAGEFRISEPLTLTLRLEIKQPAQQVRIGVGFNTVDGIRVATLHHTDNGQTPIDVEPGVYEVTVTLVNPLLPGTYVISVGAHRALGGATLDYVPEALRFHVIELTTGEDIHAQYNAGLVQFRASWSQPRWIS